MQNGFGGVFIEKFAVVLHFLHICYHSGIFLYVVFFDCDLMCCLTALTYDPVDKDEEESEENETSVPNPYLLINGGNAQE